LYCTTTDLSIYIILRLPADDMGVRASMIWIRRKLDITVGALLFVSVSLLILVPLACNSSQDRENHSTLNVVDKGNPKLESTLNQLVDAAKRGEAELFAEQINIELVDNHIRVIIECVPNQLESTIEVVTSTGARIEASYDDLLQVVVSINMLSNLTNSDSIRFIRLPQQALPALGQPG